MSYPHQCKLVYYLQELSFRNSVTIQNYSMRFIASSAFIKHDKELSNHRRQLLDDFLSVLLHTNSSGVPRRMSIHGANDSRNGWLLVVARRWMSYICPQEDHRLIEHLSSQNLYHCKSLQLNQRHKN